MAQPTWQTPVLVIADDFTGANDAGSGLAQAGARVHVLFDAAKAASTQAADVWVISTDSRAVAPAEAARRVTEALHHHHHAADRGWIFKKIDSTLRGNVGVEIAAALSSSGKQLALVAPAVPKLGRITRHGEVLIDGVALTETEFASDPKTPVMSSRVLTQLQLPGEVLSRAQLKQPDLAQWLSRQQGVVVVDAEDEADLSLLIAAAVQLSPKPLLVGAAGLSDALARQSGQAATRPVTVQPAAVKRPQPVLAVIGSMSISAQQQIAQLARLRDITLVDIDITQLFAQPAWPEKAHWFERSLSALRQGQHVVIRTCQQADQRHQIDALCQQNRISRQQLGESICQFLGELSQQLCHACLPAALYLSGGDVAIAVARSLGASGFQTEGLVAGCVPHGRLLNSEFTLPVMTKAGGFGDENTLVEAIRFIEEKLSE